MKRTLHMNKRDKMIAAGFAVTLIASMAIGNSEPVPTNELAEMKTISVALGPAAAKDSKALRCLALNIYHEARGEDVSGKVAVAHVVMNRVSDRRFPGSVCGVVAQGGFKRNRCQFSWRCDGRSDRPRDRAQWRNSEDIARVVYAGQSADPTRGALWYHADYVDPSWKYFMTKGPKIGRHIFYSGGETTRQNTRLGWMMPVAARKPPSTSL